MQTETVMSNKIEHRRAEELANRLTKRIFSAVRLGARALTELGTNQVLANDPDVNDDSPNVQRKFNALYPKEYLKDLNKVATAAEATAAKATGHETWAAFEAATLMHAELFTDEESPADGAA